MSKYQRKLDYRGWEELYSDCLMAIDKAITKHDVTSGFALGTLVRVCISQAICVWYRRYFNDKQKHTRNDTIYIGDDYDEYTQEYDTDKPFTLTLL